jgi:hypothetical protein
LWHPRGCFGRGSLSISAQSASGRRQPSSRTRRFVVFTPSFFTIPRIWEAQPLPRCRLAEHGGLDRQEQRGLAEFLIQPAHLGAGALVVLGDGRRQWLPSASTRIKLSPKLATAIPAIVALFPAISFWTKQFPRLVLAPNLTQHRFDDKKYLYPA